MDFCEEIFFLTFLNLLKLVISQVGNICKYFSVYTVYYFKNLQQYSEKHSEVFKIIFPQNQSILVFNFLLNFHLKANLRKICSITEILIRLQLSEQFFVGQQGENGRIGIVLNSLYMDWVCMCDAFGEPKMMPRADINIKTIRKLLPYTYSGIKTTAVYRIPKLLCLSD